MIDYSPLSFSVAPMRPEDIPQVMQIEKVAFSAPWSARAYEYELHYNEMAHYYVARPRRELARSHPPHVGDDDHKSRVSLWDRIRGHEREESAIQTDDSLPIVGYGGFWLMVDEAHISTIASHPDWRRRGVGELLLLAMIDGSLEIGANMVTLEVRASNSNAQRLYRKYGFEVVGLRKGYYSDNGEDAYIMTTPNIGTAEYSRRIKDLRAQLFKVLSR